MKGPKNGVLKASIKDTPIEDRKSFYKASCMLLISVGQPYHEGEKLTATIDLIKNKFHSCTIMVCDTLQKYNLMEHHNEEDAYKLSLQKGDEWLIRSKEQFAKLEIPYNIIRWDDIIQDVTFPAKLRQVEELYRSNPAYCNAFLNTVDSYFLRLMKRGEVLDKEERYKISLKYLIEECAGMLIWADRGYNFEVYPTTRAEVMAATFEFLIKPFYIDTLLPVALRFKRYAKNNQEQENKNLHLNMIMNTA